MQESIFSIRVLGRFSLGLLPAPVDGQLCQEARERWHVSCILGTQVQGRGADRVLGMKDQSRKEAEVLRVQDWDRLKGSGGFKEFPPEKRRVGSNC